MLRGRRALWRGVLRGICGLQRCGLISSVEEG